MTIALDRARVGRLADVDPDLPALADALRVALDRPGWQLHDVRWTPGQHCRLAFAVAAFDGPRRFVAADVTPDGWEERDYRQDTALRGMLDATDPSRVAELLAPLVGAAPATCVVEPVRYRPASRCVLRYRMSGVSPDEVFAKVLPQPAPAMAAAWRMLSEGAGRSPLVPTFLGDWPGHDVLLAAPATGTSVSHMLAHPTRPASERARVAYALGRLLARLHGQTTVEAPLATDDDQLASLRALVAVARHADAGAAARLSIVIDGLDEHRPEPGPAVLAHGGFRAGQTVLTASGDLVLLDLDGINRGDAGRDVALALAHFTWHGIKHPTRKRAMGEAADAFLAGYGAHADRLVPDSLAWWRVAALVQLAGRRFRRLETDDWPRLPALFDSAEGLVAERARRRRNRPHHASSRLDAVRAVLQDAAPLPTAVAVELTEVLGAPTQRRAVHQYVVRGLDGPEPVTVIAKWFDEPARAELLHQHLSTLAAGPFATGSLRVPAPVAVSTERHLVVFRSDPGTPLDRLDAPDAAQDGVRWAARWLARLHQSAVTLPRRMDLDGEVTTSDEWATVIGEHHPDRLAAARHLARSWRTALGATGAIGATWGPIHKDFHAGHVLIGDGVCVIDLDEARIGDPRLDVAHFVTYLRLARPADAAELLIRSFLGEYAAAGGPAGETVAGYEAYTWLKIAKQWTTGRAHGRDADATQRRRGVDEALTRGSACLSA